MPSFFAVLVTGPEFRVDSRYAARDTPSFIFKISGVDSGNV